MANKGIKDLPITSSINTGDLFIVEKQIGGTHKIDANILTQNGVYPENLKMEVINPVGGFKPGDSLLGMSVNQIIEKLLCTEATL